MGVWASSIDFRRSHEVVFELQTNIRDVQQSDGSPVLAFDLRTECAQQINVVYESVDEAEGIVLGDVIASACRQ
jgi:hypothetical protein